MKVLITDAITESAIGTRTIPGINFVHDLSINAACKLIRSFRYSRTKLENAIKAELTAGRKGNCFILAVDTDTIRFAVSCKENQTCFLIHNIPEEYPEDPEDN